MQAGHGEFSVVTHDKLWTWPELSAKGLDGGARRRGPRAHRVCSDNLEGHSQELVHGDQRMGLWARRAGWAHAQVEMCTRIRMADQEIDSQDRHVIG